MSARYYTNSPLSNGSITLSGPEAHHLAVVCRLRPNDPVCLFNGDGHEYCGIVKEVSRRSVVIEVSSVRSPNRELGFRLEVAAPLPKGDRAQLLIEKLTELGVTKYIPLRTEWSVIDAGGSRIEKLKRYVIEASKQCGRNVLMAIEEPVDWTTYASSVDLPQTRWLGDLNGSPELPPRDSDVAIAVGPEGGFTEQEIARARQEDWKMVGLGPRILRVETAAIALAVRATFRRE